MILPVKLHNVTACQLRDFVNCHVSVGSNVMEVIFEKSPMMKANGGSSGIHNDKVPLTITFYGSAPFIVCSH